MCEDLSGRAVMTDEAGPVLLQYKNKIMVPGRDNGAEVGV